jgi:hypothetical protein
LSKIESELGIQKGMALQEVRYAGRELEKQQHNDKIMTQYAIALHIVGKNLLNLNFNKEAKHFITKAHYCVTKMLILEKKTDLQVAIQLDMRAVLEKTRYLQEVGVRDAGDKNKALGKYQNNSTKKE